MAKARKLPSGNWIAEGFYVTSEGKRVRKSFTAHDAKTAEFLAQQFALEHKLPDRDTFDAALEDYIKTSKPVLSPYTIKSYLAIQKALREDYKAFCSLRVDEVERKHIQNIVNSLSKDHSPKTVRNYYGLITVVLRQREKVFPGVKLPQKERPKLAIPDTQTVKAIIKATEGTPLHVPVLLAVVGTMRCGEICALTMDDIDGCNIHVNKSLVIQDGEYVPKPPKTYGSDRFVTVPQDIIDEINAQGYVTDLTPNAVCKRFERMLKKEGLPACRFHDLRHYSASRMHAMGIPTAEIMKRGGWTTEATLANVYRHALDSRFQTDTNKINRQFSLLLK